MGTLRNRAGGRLCQAFIPVVLCAVTLHVPAAAEAETVVRFSYWANHEENSGLWQQVCEEFERQNPGIRIKREWYLGDYGRKLQMVFISNTAADIILMDDEIFPSYSVRGYLEDLRPYIERKSDTLERLLAAELQYLNTPEEEREPGVHRELLPTCLESFNYRGFQGGLPWNGFAVVMFYNKELFDREGLPYPRKDWTWEEFRAIAKKLTKDLDGDGRADQFGTNLSFDFLALEPVVWSFGGEILNADNTRCAIHEPEGLEAVRFLYDMKFKDRSLAWSGEMGGILPDVQLLTGRLAMVPAPSYAVPSFNRVTDALRWGIAHMPIGPRGDRHTRVTWNGISIYRHAPPDKKEAAWKFVKHLMSEDVQAAIGAKQRGLPVRRAQALRYYVDPATPAEEEVVLDATEYGKLTPITPRYMELREAMASELAGLNIAEITGTTPEQALARLAPKINRVLEKEIVDWHKKQEPDARGASAAMSALKALGFACALCLAACLALASIPAVRMGSRRQFHELRAVVRSQRARNRAIEGILFASPWLLGLCLFTAFPIVFSIVLSLCEWDPYEPIAKMKFIGLGNFARALSADPVTGDPLVRMALYNTFYYAFLAVPLGLCASLSLALLLNQKFRGITLFRTVFYLPSVVSGVATVIMWTFIFDPIFGPLTSAIRTVNAFLDHTAVFAFINLPEPMWLNDPHWAKPSMIIMSLWGAGGAGMLVFLAGLQGVPDQLYEAAEVDGAGRLRKFWNITLPMLTPTIYFNLIMGIIGSLNVFMQAFIMTNGSGGVDYSLLFYVLYLYNKAFVEFEMGYASALAWILFAIILAFTLLGIRSSALWVYYEGERKP